jgi:hypothetical protein
MIICTVFIAGCGSTREAEKMKTPSVATTDLQRYESEFRPSDYDLDVNVFLADLRKEKERKSIHTQQPLPEQTATLPGFRVQLFASSEIDSAVARKTEAEAAFPGEWFYIVYDPPTYKLRGGNFLNRADADAYAQFVSSNGFPDAWIVPERVFKNIPPRHISPPNPEELPKR